MEDFRGKGLNKKEELEKYRVRIFDGHKTLKWKILNTDEYL